MKKNKLIGLVVATAGVVASFAAAAALYTKNADAIEFGIGAKYEGKEGYITYKVNNSVSGTVAPKYCTNYTVQSGLTNKEDGTGLGGDYTQIKYEFQLGATFTPESLHAQDYVVGDFSINLTNIHESFRGHAHIWVSTQGFASGSLGEHYYSSWMEQDAALDAATYSIHKELTVSSTYEQSVVLYIKLDSAVIDDALMELNGAKFCDISATWDKSASFEYAYVVGSMTSWEKDEAYAMTPNIAHTMENENDWEWAYTNLKEAQIAGENAKAKCQKGEGDGSYSAGDDFSLDPSTTYTVTWKEGQEAVFTPKGSN